MRFLADEMLGRLARYLRMVGCDTADLRGATDSEVAERARLEGRRLLTRDRRRAARIDGAILLTEVEISRQVQQLHRQCPELRWTPRPARCTLCNGVLNPVALSEREALAAPERLRRSDQPIWRCPNCGHIYWIGSHLDRLAADLARWIGEVQA